MDAKACWVAEGYGWLSVYAEPPTWDGEWWSQTDDGEMKLSLYWTLGLPSEPAPGSCWEVRWIEGNNAVYGDGVIAFARDVTEELKAVRRD